METGEVEFALRRRYNVEIFFVDLFDRYDKKKFSEKTFKFKCYDESVETKSIKVWIRYAAYKRGVLF